MLSRLKNIAEKLLAPIARAVLKAGLSPNVLTVLGLVLAALAALFYSLKGILLALISLFVSGLLDALDGTVARMSQKSSAAGGFLDAVSDRYSDAFLILGIVIGGYCDVLIGLLALSGCMLVSYARARAESLGVREFGIGLAERPERLIIIMVGTALEMVHAGSLYVSMIVLSILAHITAIQRTFYALRCLK